MVKKTLVIFTLSLLLVGMTETGVYSWPDSTISGWPQTSIWNPVSVDAILKKVNLTDGPLNVYLTIVVKEIQCICCNNGDQCGGEGIPFTVDITQSDITALDETLVYKNGQYLYNNLVLDFKNDDLLWDQVEPILSAIACEQNNDNNLNWSVDRDSVVVKTFYLKIRVDGYDKDGYYVDSTDEACGVYDLGSDYPYYTLLDNEYKNHGAGFCPENIDYVPSP